ncbi:MAG: transglutaminase domain-containing protein, partial [Clostridia bacterium]|nr:transglutaminase domain-containing protein [Clostridia bacterium]
LSLLFYGRWFTTLAGLAAGGGLLAWYVSQQSSISTFFHGIMDVGFNRILDRLYRAGYYAYAKYRVTLTPMEEANQELLAAAFVGLLTWLVAWLFVPFLVRRIRIAAPLITSLVLIVPVFTFNLPVSNWAVTGIIAGSCALLIMWGYQRRYDRDEKKEAKSPLFSDLQRPQLPERLQHQKMDKEELKALKAERRERTRRRNATGLVTVEEEINDYLDVSLTGRKKKKPTVVASAAKPTDEERQRRKEERAQIRAVHDYDRITRETRCAMGGIAGFCVMALILLILLLPTLSVDGPFNTIDAIDHRVQYYREYVTATLRGNDPALEMYAYGESIRNEAPHSTTAETQLFEEIEMFRIYTQFRTPLYLQWWVGVDYTDCAWSSANDDQIFRWRELYDAADMPAEAMFEGFFQLMDPTGGVEIEDMEDLRKKYYDYDEYGFVAFMVNIRRMRQMGAELYLPRVTSDTLRILNYQTVTPVEQPWAQYFDGVVVSSILDEEVADYSVEAFVPMQLNPEWYLNTSALIAAYNASTAEILRYEASRNKGAFRPDYLNTYIDVKGGERYSAAQQYIESMGYSERAKVLSDIKDAQMYADFVYETYLDTAQSEIISNLAKKLYEETYPDECYETAINEETGLLERTGLLPGAKPYNFALASMRDSRFVDTYTQRHLLTMAVINYLVENHKYSLEITAAADPMLDGVENFLTVTKEGYCVQFASAAALLLRECGIPTRYMEGYVCSDFTRRVGSNADYTRFAGQVRDSDKHAWIEVWFDGIGWVVYETTPPYYTELYGETSTTASTLTPTAPDRDPIDTPTPPVDVPPEGEILPPEEQDPQGGEGGIDVKLLIKYILITIVVVAALCAVVIFVVEVVRRGRLAQEKRTQLAQQIASGDTAVFDSAQSREAAAKALIRNTLQLLTMYGTAPKTGELRDDYAQRLSFAYEDMLGYPMEYDDGALGQRESVSRFRLGELLEAVAAEEFGYGMPDGDLKKLAELYLVLHEKRAARISSVKRFT